MDYYLLIKEKVEISSCLLKVVSRAARLHEELWLLAAPLIQFLWKQVLDQQM